MIAKWEKDNCPKALLADIILNLSLTNDGNVSCKMGIEFSIDALFSKVIHSYDLDHDVLLNEFRDAITTTYKKNKLSNPREILTEFGKKCNLTLKNNHKYFLISSISLKKSYLPKRRSINDCVIRFFKHIPKKYQKDRKNLLSDHSNLNLSEQKDFLYVIISVKAPNVKTAYMKAIGALDIIRAIWQIGFKKNINFLALRKEHEYPSHAIISLGQVHSLHLGNGKKAWEGIWYEPNFKEINAIQISDFRLTEKNLDHSLKKIRNNPFKGHVYESLKSYINALDHQDQEFRFMKLWSTIEKLIKSDTSKMIICRVSFFYENRRIHKEVLESLRKARNINAHHGVKPFNVEMKNYRLCTYVDTLLGFFINNPFHYKTMEEALGFISLPTKLQTIDEQIKNLNAVKKFIGTS